MLDLRGHTLAFIGGSFTSAIKSFCVFRKFVYASTAILCLLVLAIIYPLYFVPDCSEAATGTATESTLIFSFVNNKNTASVSLDVSDRAGSFATSTAGESAEFSLATNNATGYTLVLRTNGSTTTLSDGTDSIASINNTKTSSNFTVNTWGLLPSKYNSSINTTNYYPASNAGFTIDTTSTANTTANTYTIGVGIKADFTKQAGVYTSANLDNGNTGVSLVLAYVANPVNYSITYDKGNISGTPSNIPAIQSGSVTSTSITLSNTVPAITGYTFAGWCLGTVTTPSNETDTCSGTVYNPNGTGTNLAFGIDKTVNNAVALHAMWSRATVAVTVNFAGNGVTGVTFTNATYGNISITTSGNIANLKYGVQYNISGIYDTYYEFDSWAATAGILGSTSSASTSYSTITVATLSLTGKHGPYCTSNDSNCMQYATYASCGQTLMDARDGNTYTTAEINDLCWMTKNLNLPGGTVLTSELTNVPDDYSTNTAGFTNGNTLPASSTTGFVNNATAYVYNTGSTSCTNNSPCYSYYSWRAAAAGYNTSTDGTSLSYDICPKGWRLPTSSEATALRDKYNYGSSLNASPFTGVYSAYYYDGAFIGGGTYGFYWTSTSYDGSFAYYLFYSSSYSNVANDGNKSNGNAIRCVKESNYLYNAVAAMSKGIQTNSQLRAAITVPTSADYSQDTSNSGVYEYNSSVFGTSSDASNDYKIYYYRGVLENTVSTYGSDGSAATYPNYVILQAGSSRATTDTCWRIIRTTGSGGIKIIYNGKWTGSTCANSQSNAQVTTLSFGLKGNSAKSTWYYNINRVGYTFNNTQSLQDSTTSTSTDTLFGSNSNLSVNNERSNIKKYIEDTWYASNLANWTSKLEANAGYCNDRSTFSDVSGSTTLTSIIPYTDTSDSGVYFGSNVRDTNQSGARKTPSLNCPRSTVDLYRYVSGSAGLSNQLKYPVSLITADEVSFAGSGWSSVTIPNHANSFLRSGSKFWLLSPSIKFNSGAGVYGFMINVDGSLSRERVDTAIGVRPVVSLAPGTMITGGSGIATDPWIVQ